MGNINAKRDWGHAKIMLRKCGLCSKQASDFVISTGKQYTVKDFINLTAENLNMTIKWKGEGINEKGYDERELHNSIRSKTF